MREKAARISITIPRSLLKDFDETTCIIGYKKRSKAVCDAIRRFVAEHKILNQLKVKSCAGTVTYTYKHHVRGLTEDLLEIQHEYSGVINATLHIHLDEENCLEILSVRGDAEKIRNLVSKLKTLKTENVQYVLLPQP
jgi:CopG family nickel-responsive transcriptional regulator